RDQPVIWAIGLVGAALGLFSRGWLDRFADLMLVLGGLLVPVGGLLLAHFFVLRRKVDVAHLYQPEGPYRGASIPAFAAWIAGSLVYFMAQKIGGTLPALATTLAAYCLLVR